MQGAGAQLEEGEILDATSFRMHDSFNAPQVLAEESLPVRKDNQWGFQNLAPQMGEEYVGGLGYELTDFNTVNTIPMNMGKENGTNIGADYNQHEAITHL